MAEKDVGGDHAVVGGPWKSKVEAKTATEAFCRVGRRSNAKTVVAQQWCGPCGLAKERAMKVKELMRTSVARVLPAATVGEALSRMDGSGVTSLPVEDAQGFLLGFVGRADLSRAIAEGTVAPSAAVGDGLSSHLATATPEMDVARVAEMMRDRGVDDIMVVEGRSLVGALSLAEAGKAGPAEADQCHRAG